MRCPGTATGYSRARYIRLLSTRNACSWHVETFYHFTGHPARETATACRSKGSCSFVLVPTNNLRTFIAGSAINARAPNARRSERFPFPRALTLLLPASSWPMHACTHPVRATEHRTTYSYVSTFQHVLLRARSAGWPAGAGWSAHSHLHCSREQYFQTE